MTQIFIHLTSEITTFASVSDYIYMQKLLHLDWWIMMLILENYYNIYSNSYNVKCWNSQFKHQK